jgi:NAD+ diphosphatase
MIKHSIPFSDELEGWWSVIFSNKILLPEPKRKIPFGRLSDLSLAVSNPETIHQIGEFDGAPVYTFDVAGIDQSSPHFDEFAGLRSVLFEHPEMFEFAARSFQVSEFLKTHQYCGQCSKPMKLIDWELATQCEPCRHRCYPRISPVVIMAIRKGKQILLAKNRRTTSGFHSVLAGFVESGETLEQAVHREVFEEVGIKVKNLRYFDSQPWPFPHSLMVGFLAEYDSGELNLCDHEIAEADWYDFTNLPSIPPKQTISRQLIEQTKKVAFR